MTPYWIELGLNTTFALFVVIHGAILIAVIWHVFRAINERQTGTIRSVNHSDESINVRPICLQGASSSGLDFSSISSIPDTTSRLKVKRRWCPWERYAKSGFRSGSP